MKRGSLRRPIPDHIRAQLDADPEYHGCALRHYSLGLCDGRIQWHHAVTYQGRRIDDAFSIVALCTYHHEKEAKYRRLIDAIIMSRVTPEIRAKYPRKVWPMIK